MQKKLFIALVNFCPNIFVLSVVIIKKFIKQKQLSISLIKKKNAFYNKTDLCIYGL